MDLKGKVAIVTGAGSGIGKAVALMLLKERVKVVACSNVKGELDELCMEGHELGGEIVSLCVDLEQSENAATLVNFAVATYGGIDILFNNAGIFVQAPFEEMPLEKWDKSFNINVRAQFVLDQLVLKSMKTRDEGYIINTSSSIVFSQGGAESDRAPYFASKMAVVGLSRALLQEAKRYGIKVTTIYPDRVKTNMTKTITWEGVNKEEVSWLLPEDIANGVLFLLKTSERCFIADLYFKNWIK